MQRWAFFHSSQVDVPQTQEGTDTKTMDWQKDRGDLQRQRRFRQRNFWQTITTPTTEIPLQLFTQCALMSRTF